MCRDRYGREKKNDDKRVKLIFAKAFFLYFHHYYYLANELMCLQKFRRSLTKYGKIYQNLITKKKQLKQSAFWLNIPLNYY